MIQSYIKMENKYNIIYIYEIKKISYLFFCNIHIMLVFQCCDQRIKFQCSVTIIQTDIYVCRPYSYVVWINNIYTYLYLSYVYMYGIHLSSPVYII